MSTVGTWAWAERTDGRLDRVDRAELLRQGVLARLGQLPGRLRSKVIAEAGPVELPTPPDSALAEAITLHLNITVPSALGVEASLLSKGVSLDTVGRRVESMPAPTIAAVATHWPRENFTEWLVAASDRQANIRPQSRSAFLSRFGFAGLLRGNPLDRG